MIATIGVDERRPGLQHQRRHRRRRDRDRARRREARVPHRRRRASTPTIPTSRALISRIDVDGLASDARRRQGRRRDDPEAASRACDALRGGVRRAHILDGRIPHALLLEFFTREGIGTMIDDDHRASDREHDRTDGLHRDPGARRRARACRPTAGSRSRSCAARARGSGTARATSTSTSSAGSRSRRSGTRTPRWPTRSPSRPARCCTSRTSTTTSGSRRSPRSSTRLLGGGGRVFFANSGAEANECAIKLARRYGQANGGPERFHVLSAYGLVPRPHAHHARRHRPAPEAGDVPAAARGVPPGRVRRRSTRWPRRWTSGCAR